ncbi:unnamed protein product [Phytophthora fragariaefolia]|uniref:Unnamed protein product n=1 Tax=Phytophthora fragariaefolia TaxID=1490495 RepID=A0A9W6THM8_9STRA|nr:unnamed protein product [Phytophthora fragariaefolia]
MASEHGTPPEGLECMATMDDITLEDGNYCEFQTAPSGRWHAALFCADVVEQLLASQFHTFMKKVQEADCKAELRRLVAKGPPVWLEDKHALPLPEGDAHISQIWFARDGRERSAKLDGALEGEARDKLWSELRQLMEAMEEDKEEVRMALTSAMFVLILTTLAIVVSSATLPAGRDLNTSDYWREDRPRSHQPHWKRQADGKVVSAINDSTPNTFAAYHDAVEAQTPWIAKWVLSAQGRRTLKKDIPRLLMYNLVSPMDYGSSIRSSNVRRRRNKAIGMFLTDNMALPLLKSLGNVAWNLIQSHYVGYFEDEIFAKRLEVMNSSEMIREFNLSVPIDDGEVEETRPNVTMRYTFDGASQRTVLYSPYNAAFTPYGGYSDQYYTRTDNLPPPTLPADSYPWLWSPRLDLLQSITRQLIQTLIRDDVEKSESDAASFGRSISRQLRDLVEQKLPNTRNASVVTSVAARVINESLDRSATNPQDVRALEQIQLMFDEFHFETGIPRFRLRSNDTHSVFPSFPAFLRATQVNIGERNISLAEESNATSISRGSRDAESSESFTLGSHSDGSSSSVNKTADFSSRSGVYAALLNFYAYPSVDRWMVARDKTFNEENSSTNECVLESPCWMQSGVTVYTPSLTTLMLHKMFSDARVNSLTKRTTRITALLTMVKVAFEAERRALKHGLQAPSTVWYAKHDLDVDEFADAVLGAVNMSKSEDPIPLHVFEKFMNERVPVLDEIVSYYADTIHDTKTSMGLNHSISMLDKFAESELVKLVSLLVSEMKILDRSITSYMENRAANMQYQEVVSATQRGDLYNGSEYTLVGFGFMLLATNDKNVLGANVPSRELAADQSNTNNTKPLELRHAIPDPHLFTVVEADAPDFIAGSVVAAATPVLATGSEVWADWEVYESAAPEVAAWVVAVEVEVEVAAPLAVDGVVFAVVAPLDMAVAEVDACVFDAMNTSVDEEGHGVVAPVGVVPPETPTDTPGLPPLTPVPVLKPLFSPLVSPLASPLEMVEAVSSSQGISALRPAKRR